MFLTLMTPLANDQKRKIEAIYNFRNVDWRPVKVFSVFIAFIFFLSYPAILEKTIPFLPICFIFPVVIIMLVLVIARCRYRLTLISSDHEKWFEEVKLFSKKMYPITGAKVEIYELAAAGATKSRFVKISSNGKTVKIGRILNREAIQNLKTILDIKFNQFHFPTVGVDQHYPEDR